MDETKSRVLHFQLGSCLLKVMRPIDINNGRFVGLHLRGDLLAMSSLGQQESWLIGAFWQALEWVSVVAELEMLLIGLGEGWGGWQTTSLSDSIWTYLVRLRKTFTGTIKGEKLGLVNNHQYYRGVYVEVEVSKVGNMSCCCLPLVNVLWVKSGASLLEHLLSKLMRMMLLRHVSPSFNTKIL